MVFLLMIIYHIFIRSLANIALLADFLKAHIILGNIGLLYLYTEFILTVLVSISKHGMVALLHLT
jgi:hypothetical protein